MNDNIKENKMSKLTKEQSELLEATYSVIYEELRKVQSLVNISREGFINVHGEFNKNINSYDIDATLQAMQDLLTPVVSEVCEAAAIPDYFLWERDHKNSYDLWKKVDSRLQATKKRKHINETRG